MKRLTLISMAILFLASCKTVALQQEYSLQNGKPVKVGEPQPLQLKDGGTFYRIYKMPSSKFKKS